MRDMPSARTQSVLVSADGDAGTEAGAGAASAAGPVALAPKLIAWAKVHN